MKNNILIVTGGTADYRLVERYYRSGDYDYIIGVDHGVDALEELNIRPNLVIGDFDSASAGIRAKYKSNPDAVFLNPEKDLTDTHAAVLKSIEMSPRRITILGATGTRIDHMMGNIAVLMLAVEAGIDAEIVDNHNRIRMIDKHYVLYKKSQYGKYVSLIPYTDSVNGITLTGFKYELNNASMIKGDTIGISNEIREEEGHIYIKDGYLLVMETED